MHDIPTYEAHKGHRFTHTDIGQSIQLYIGLNDYYVAAAKIVAQHHV